MFSVPMPHPTKGKRKELQKAAQISFILAKITKENILVGYICLFGSYGVVEKRYFVIRHPGIYLLYPGFLPRWWTSMG